MAILDMVLSDMDGWVIVQKIKKTRPKAITVLMVSAHHGVLDSINKSSVNSFFAKFFDTSKLLQELKPLGV